MALRQTARQGSLVAELGVLATYQVHRRGRLAFDSVAVIRRLESALSGEPVTALCGKVWVPGRDPKKFPVCPTCQEIYDGLRAPQDGDK